MVFAKHDHSERVFNRWRSAVQRVAVGLLGLACGSAFSQFDPSIGGYAFAIEGSNSNTLTSMVIQADGKIILAGSCTNAGTPNFCVARLTNAGVLDTSFVSTGGKQGAFWQSIGTADNSARAVALQPDGKIVLAGSCRVGAVYRFCLTRLHRDGALDTGFNGPGPGGVGLGSGAGRFLLPAFLAPGAATDLLKAMAIQADGKIVVAGQCLPDVSAASRFCVARLNGDGSLDRNFQGPGGTGNGAFSFAHLWSGYPDAIRIQPDGKILLAGVCVTPTGQDFCAARLHGTTGGYDTNFDGGDMIVALTGNGRIVVPVAAASGDDYVSSMVLTPDNTIILAGSCRRASLFEFCGLRLETDSGRSLTFSGTRTYGFFDLMASGHSYATGIVLHDDGRFTLAGQCHNGTTNQFCIARHNANGTLDSGSANTVFGDGRFILPPILQNDRASAIALQPRGNNASYDGSLVVAGTCGLGSTDFFCVTRINNQDSGINCKLDIDDDGKMLGTVDGLILTRIMLGFDNSAAIRGITFGSDARRNTWPKISEYLIAHCGMTLRGD